MSVTSHSRAAQVAYACSALTGQTTLTAPASEPVTRAHRSKRRAQPIAVACVRRSAILGAVTKGEKQTAASAASQARNLQLRSSTGRARVARLR